MTFARFAVIGCSRCRRMMVADLSRATKTCQCGHKIDLAKVAHLAESASADAAGEMLRQITARRNSDFTSAEQLASFSAADTLREKRS